MQYVIACLLLSLCAILIWRGWWATMPCFTAFCAAFGVSLALWDPRSVTGLSWATVALLVGKLFATGEAFWICSDWLAPTERRRLAAFAAGVAAVVIWRTAHLYGDTSDLGLYRAVRQHVHTTLAMMLVAGAGCLWIRPPTIQPTRRRHGLIWTAFMLVHAGTGLMWGILRPGLELAVRAGVPGSRAAYASDHEAIRVLYLLGCGVCIVAWIALFLQRPNPRLNARDSVL